jgi:flagellar motor switch protein FliN/FliY
MSLDNEATVASKKPPVDPAAAGSTDRNLELLFDVPLSLSAELGGCRLKIKEVLQLTRGKVIELEKLAGEPLDILLNGQLIAHGEAVVVNERFGVRIVDIASPHERLSRLQR